MSEDAIIRLVVTAAGIFIALAIFGAMNTYYASAKEQAGLIMADTNPEERYEITIREMFEKEELEGYEVKNFLNYNFESDEVLINIYNVKYIDNNNQEKSITLLNSNNSLLNETNNNYDKALNTIYPFQKFQVIKTQHENYIEYRLNGK